MMKLFSFLVLFAFSFTGFAQQKLFNISSYGAVGDGVTDNTTSIQKTIDAASEQGGGIVWIPKGLFLTTPITLKSNITLSLAADAVLLGSAKRTDYGAADNASPLIAAYNLQNIAITGKGTIDGNGEKLLKNLIQMLNDGSLKDSAWGKLNAWHQMQPREQNRPKIIGFTNCTGIQIKGITIKHSLDWVEDYKNCSNMVVDSIKVESNTYWNNDGIDIVDCKNVKVTNSFFNADDDGICLKSEDPKGMCENIYIADCKIRSSASGIKLGTASFGGFKNIIIKNVKVYDTYRSAIALECVDGGIMQDIDVSHIDAVNTGNAIFIRLGHRNTDSVFSKINGIRISDVNVMVPAGKPDKGYPMEGPPNRFPHNVFPSSIAGLPGHPVQNVKLENIRIVYYGLASKSIAYTSIDSIKSITENAAGYPEFSMFGELPAWGFYARHAQGITFKNVTLNCLGEDFRAACVFDDIDGLTLNTVKIPQVKSLPVVLFNHVIHQSVHDLAIPCTVKNKVKTVDN